MARISKSIIALFLGMSAFSADGVPPAHDHARIGYVPREIMNRPVSVREGIGSTHERVTTPSTQAQRFYDQGQSYLYSYVWIEAARSFHQALRFDPKFAMAYVGLSYAYSPTDYEAATDALAHAAALSRRISDRERRRIEIRRLQLEAMAQPQDAEKLTAFRRAIDEALEKDPDDVALLLIRGNAEEPTPFGDGQGCVPSAIPYYKRVLELSPRNFAANHFLAHCYENRGDGDDAFIYARSYAQLAPSVAHAHHMLGHELRRSGRVPDALAQFRRANQIELDYSRAEDIPVFLDWHYAHNLGLLASCYQWLGQMKSAEAVLRKEISVPVFTDYAMLNRGNWPMFLLNRQRSLEAKRASEAMQRLPSPLAQAAGHALAGQADILGGENGARAELEAASTLARRLSAQDAAAVRPYLLALDAELQLIAGQHEAAIAEVRELIGRAQAANNPDAWAQGVFQLELLALSARDHHDWQVAEELALAMIERDPDYAGAHLALALVHEHKNDVKSATEDYLKAATLWKTADPDLPELKLVHKHLDSSSHRSGSGSLQIPEAAVDHAPEN